MRSHKLNQTPDAYLRQIECVRDAYLRSLQLGVARLWRLRPIRIGQIVVKVLDLLRNLFQLLRVLGDDVLANEFGTSELLATQRAQPLICRQLNAIGRNKGLDLSTKARIK